MGSVENSHLVAGETRVMYAPKVNVMALKSCKVDDC